jgi:hypothetical protein
MDPERRLVLERLANMLLKFGIANDAQDHNCGPEAEQLRSDARTGTQELMEAHPFLVDMLGNWGRDLESRWSQALDVVEAALNRKKSYPYWAILRIKTDHGVLAYEGSKEVAIFPSLDEARAQLGHIVREPEELLLIVEARAEWKYHMPDGRRFAPRMGMPLADYL